MSTKTLRKRIALAAVTALGAGLLSVVSTPAANAWNSTTGANVINVATSNSDTATAAVTTSLASARSVGVLAVDTSSALAGTATMLSNGTIVVSNGVSTTASAFVVVGGLITAATPLVTIAQTQTSADVSGDAGNKAIAVRPNSGVTSMTISLQVLLEFCQWQIH
jgi:hypothetical protein